MDDNGTASANGHQLNRQQMPVQDGYPTPQTPLTGAALDLGVVTPGSLLGNDNDSSNASSPLESNSNSPGNGQYFPTQQLAAAHSLIPGNNIATGLVAILQHKPRGSHGQWHPIKPNQRIRVTNKLGKMVRVVARTALECDWAGMSLTMMEKTKEGTWTPCPESGYNIESKKLFREQNNLTKETSYFVQFDIKVYIMYKTVTYFVVATTIDGDSLAAQTIEIVTHNSGINETAKREREEKAEAEALAKRRREMGENPNGPASQPAQPAATFTTVSLPIALSVSNSPVSSAPKLGEVPKGIATASGQAIDMTGPGASPSAPSVATTATATVTTPNGDSSSILAPSEAMMASAAVGGGLQNGDNVPISWQFVPGNLQVEGVVRARSFVQYSDLRLKSNVVDLVDALNIVSNLQGKSYQWKKGVVPGEDEEQQGGKRVLGLIAQDVQKILPECVHETPDGYLSVNYIEIIPILIEALKQHVKQTEFMQENIQEELKELREIVQHTKAAADLHKQVHEMRSRLSKLSLRMQSKSSLLKNPLEFSTSESYTAQKPAAGAQNEIIAAPFIINALDNSFTVEELALGGNAKEPASYVRSKTPKKKPSTSDSKTTTTSSGANSEDQQQLSAQSGLDAGEEEEQEAEDEEKTAKFSPRDDGTDAAAAAKPAAKKRVRRKKKVALSKANNKASSTSKSSKDSTSRSRTSSASSQVQSPRHRGIRVNQVEMDVLGAAGTADTKSKRRKPRAKAPVAGAEASAAPASASAARADPEASAAATEASAKVDMGVGASAGTQSAVKQWFMNNWRILSVMGAIAAVLVIGACLLWYYDAFGLRAANANAPRPNGPPPVEWTPNLLLNGGFEDLVDPTVATGWSGNYDIITYNPTNRRQIQNDNGTSLDDHNPTQFDHGLYAIHMKNRGNDLAVNATQVVLRPSDAGEWQKLKCAIWANGRNSGGPIRENLPSNVFGLLPNEGFFGLAILIKYKFDLTPQLETISFPTGQPGWLFQEVVFDLNQDRGIERGTFVLIMANHAGDGFFDKIGCSVGRILPSPELPPS